MEGLTVGLFGHIEGVGKELGKKGTSTDITLYNYKQGEKAICYVEPTRYPDRINPLIYCINMMDYALVFINEITGELGETLLALDMFGVDRGSFVIGEYVDLEMLKNIISQTTMKNFDIMEKDFITLREKMINLEIERDYSAPIKIPIDHYFTVRSVGTVVLGKVETGTVKVHDELRVYPTDNVAMVRSIQIHDNDFKEAKAGNRVGLALKGVSTDDLDRGMILSNGELGVADALTLNMNWNPFMQKSVKEGEHYQIIVGLQSVPCVVEKVDDKKLEISLQKKVVYDKEDKFCLVDGSAKIRILGIGSLG
ncbi:elongation factor Tu domain 2 protein [Methanocaldococcus vulcanius M7]|uniref:Elongation factor Tu domain 2 protein n=1 Tax=Methanocaldococcus vulcanius (strain ATCC 700851 / DSM 12094 / M7) TaxID=579137 RepID=C9RG99_METVM|nr:EF-Tu/IF-2/RF-3 family GTPase [Methanocaldococcus vulcanius]ACX72601.1 elongation factor Tu domain 2 protein [Methanocaldococcus vulcanius M7]